MRLADHLRRFHAGRWAICLAMTLVIPGGAQNIPPPHTPMQEPMGQRPGGVFEDAGESNLAEQQERLTALNRERQKTIISDTVKLLKLANELDAEIKSTNPESLTATQLHKLAEIEKLAHNVKDKMSFSLKAPTVVPQSPYSVTVP